MITRVKKFFSRATKAVGERYFTIPMDGRDAHTLERVYTYELYHQLRLRTNDIPRYTWGGEVDKAAHPHFRGPGLRQRKKPDLLFHIPGNHEGNLAIIEVKTSLGVHDREAVKKDLLTLDAFRHNEHPFKAYQWAAYLIVGSYSGGEAAIGFVKKVAQQLHEEGAIDLNLIDLYWHKAPGSPAHFEFWQTVPFSSRY